MMSLAVLDKSSTIIDQDHQRVGRWMEREGAAHYRDGCTCIGLERHGRLVAGTMYDCHNGPSVFTSIAIRGRITREWLWFIVYYPFVQLDCHVLIGLIAEGNLASRNFSEHFGFTLQCRIPDADPSGAMLIYTLRKEDCRYLHRRTHV